MKLIETFRGMSLNRKLAALLLLLGFLALFAGDPYGGGKTTVDAKELALIVEKQVDHVSVDELADWIIQGRADYRLIDLRSEAEYNQYHIPTAERISLPDLPNAGLMRNEKIVLYSEGGIHSAQAWFLLRSKGYKAVYMLMGGLDEWKERILFPRPPQQPTPAEELEWQKRVQVSRWFGGEPQTEASESVVKAAPALPTPALPAAGGKTERPQAKKKKEGC